MLKQRIKLSGAIFYASYNLRFFDAAAADHLRNWPIASIPGSIERAAIEG